MKRIMFGYLFVSLLLVGCGTNKPSWVYNNSHTEKNPTPVYYRITKEKVKQVGKLLDTITPTSGYTNGAPGWMTYKKLKRNQRIRVFKIKGIDSERAVAIQYSKNGPYFKAIEQNKKP